MISTLKKLQDKKAAQEIDGGFTLIELLIVIVVLGILAAVVVFSLGSVTSKSAVSACQADGATVNTAMAAYNANNGSYPTAISDLTGSASGGPYLQSWPSNSAHYTFAMTTTADATGTTPFYPAGSLFLLATTTAPTTIPTTGAAMLTAKWTPWTGANSCITAGVK